MPDKRHVNRCCVETPPVCNLRIGCLETPPQCNRRICQSSHPVSLGTYMKIRSVESDYNFLISC